jgi:phosphoribosyl-AMP cyclohydrolase
LRIFGKHKHRSLNCKTIGALLGRHIENKDKNMADPIQFSAPGNKTELEEGTVLSPRFNKDGLMPAVTTDFKTGQVLMLAWMNAEALSLTITTRRAHYYSRSRGELWEKGATSGNTQNVIEIRTDCDQDTIWLQVEQTGNACHTGKASCFYRSIDSQGGLVPSMP